MLVLSRKSTERITIGENITIEVRRIAGNRVTLAIDAPRDIRILRGELEAAAKAFEPAEEETLTATEAPAADTADTTEPAAYHVSHHRAPLAEMLRATTPPTAAVG